MKRIMFGKPRPIMFVLLAITLVFSLTACKSDISGYITGRSMYYSVEMALSDKSIDALENRYNKLLADTVGVAMVTPDQTMAMFNDMIMIMALETANHYGLVGDMTFFLGNAGAEYDVGGKMINVGLISRSYYLSFSAGWKNSKFELESRR